MTINQSGWKPTTPIASATDTGTVTGNRALMLEEALIFEIGDTDRTGVDIAPATADTGDSKPASAFGTSLGASWFMRIPLQRWATTPTQCNPEGWLGSACQGPKDDGS